MCEDITLEAGTTSTKLAGALVAKPLGRESATHSFSKVLLNFFHVPGPSLGHRHEW